MYMLGGGGGGWVVMVQYPTTPTYIKLLTNMSNVFLLNTNFKRGLKVFFYLELRTLSGGLHGV